MRSSLPGPRGAWTVLQAGQSNTCAEDQGWGGGAWWASWAVPSEELGGAQRQQVKAGACRGKGTTQGWAWRAGPGGGAGGAGPGGRRGVARQQLTKAAAPR